MQESDRKMLVFGLDGATFDLLKPWAEAGHLPTFHRLMREGAHGALRSTIPPMTAPAWTSFMTGKNPGQHGLYDWIQRRPDNYRVSPITAAHCREPTLWSLLSDASRRVCLLNVPMTFPPSPVNGLMVSGMPAPTTRVPITYPSDLLAEIEGELGEYLLYPDPGEAYSDSGVDAFLDRLYRTTDGRLRVLDYLRQREEWDFCMAVLNGTDTVQHAMWKYMSPEHPLHNPAKRSKYGNAILHYYEYVDQALAGIVESLDRRTVLVLMSDHGFGPFHKFIHVNEWLRQKGWLAISNTLPARLKKALFTMGLTPMRAYNLMMRMGLGKLKANVVRGRGQGLLRTFFLSFDDVHWAGTAAYSLGNVGQIRLNVRGREPQGRIEPGDEYEAVRGRIMAELADLRDPDTGERVVQEIYRREEIYTGDAVEQAADIVFIPTRMEYFGFGEYEFGSSTIVEPMRRGISGTHRMNGMVLMWGEPIAEGVSLQHAQIVDLAPTILYLMNEPVPADMDGEVLVDAITEDYLAGHPILVDETRGGGGSFSSGEPQEMSPEDVDILTDRLRGLGYVG